MRVGEASLVPEGTARRKSRPVKTFGERSSGGRAVTVCQVCATTADRLSEWQTKSLRQPLREPGTDLVVECGRLTVTAVLVRRVGDELEVEMWEKTSTDNGPLTEAPFSLKGRRRR